MTQSTTMETSVLAAIGCQYGLAQCCEGEQGLDQAEAVAIDLERIGAPSRAAAVWREIELTRAAMDPD